MNPQDPPKGICIYKLVQIIYDDNVLVCCQIDGWVKLMMVWQFKSH